MRSIRTTTPVVLPTYIQARMHDVIPPIEYATACRAIALCRTLDESKHWSDKADALAAWAKIYHNDQAGIEAKRLKLHAYRRMGQLAQELRPQRMIGGQHGRHLGSTPGAKSLLLEQGLKMAHVNAAGILGRMPHKQFKALIDSPRPPAPNTVAAQRRSGSESWKTFSVGAQSVNCFRSFCRRYDAKALARGVAPGEVRKVRIVLNEGIPWLDAFEQYLPKERA